MVTRKPTSESLTFGAEVTRLREESGLTRTELAKKSAVTRSYVGQVESGITRCRRDFAERLDTALGTGTTLVDAWDELLKGTGYPRYFVEFTKAEEAAVIIRTYEWSVVPGLLQTEAYARALLSTEEAVERRMKRQAILTRDDAPVLYVVLDESVLHRKVADAAVMRGQLEHLLDVSQRLTITLQIAPTGYYRDTHSSFSLATQANGTVVAYLSYLTGGSVSNDPGDIVHCVKSFATLQANALSPDASRDLIKKGLE